MEPLKDSKQIKFRKILLAVLCTLNGGGSQDQRWETYCSHPGRRSQWPNSGVSIQENTHCSFLSLPLGFPHILELSEIKTFAFTINIQQDKKGWCPVLALQSSLESLSENTMTLFPSTGRKYHFPSFFFPPRKSLFICFCEMFFSGQCLDSLRACLYALRSS